MSARSMFAPLLLVAVALALPGDVLAQGQWPPGGAFGAARVRLGLVMLDGDSQYWEDTAAVFTGDVDDLDDLSLGFDFHWYLSRTSGLAFSTGFYQGDTTRAYREWVDGDGRDVRHMAELDTFDMTVAWVLQPTGTDAPVRPYLGLGGGLVVWELTEEGSFIDFSEPDLPIVYAAYYDDGATLEAVAFAGLEVGMSRNFAFFVEGRYRYADEELGGDFGGAGTLDLSALEVSAGLAWSF